MFGPFTISTKIEGVFGVKENVFLDISGFLTYIFWCLVSKRKNNFPRASYIYIKENPRPAYVAPPQARISF